MVEQDTDIKLNEVFAGKVVRKDLTKTLGKSENVPIYVIEYLLGQYCATDDDNIIKEGLQKVKNILADNFVRPDEAEKVKSNIREKGYYTVIDKVTVKLNERRDVYEAEFSNLGLKGVEVEPNDVKRFEKLLCGGIWCILKISYSTEESKNPFIIESLKPIQIASMKIQEFIDAREKFQTEEWIDVILRSIGMEPTQLEEKTKWHILERLVPLIENNYNLVELGPRSTGKSHVYKEISANSILMSGGQTTVANLFYNMSTRKIGLVGYWDVVAFDEVAGMNFKDKDGIQIMKDYMASGSFARGKEEKNANASIVFVGNINQSVSSLLKTAHLFQPFPESMNNDSAFFDRIHYYLPGWEVPKFKPEHFTDRYGFIVDYFAEFLREMRKRNFSDQISSYFKLGNNLNQRDVIAVTKTFSGLMKLLYPNQKATKEEIQQVLEYSLEGRRRVKEQLKRMGGMEFFDVNFSYIDNETLEEHFVSVPESGGNKLIPEGVMNPGHIFTVGYANGTKIGVYKLELQVVNGTGKFEKSGLNSNAKAKEAANTAINYFKANAKNISQMIKYKEKDYFLHIQDQYGVGLTSDIALAYFISLCSGSLNKPVDEQLVVLGTMTIGGSINSIENLADQLQICLEAGAKKILLPMSSAGKMSSVPPELFSKFQIAFYSDPIDAVYKALGFNH
ncbi:protease Lon-related BREX system protein BrxL [Candidatus Woesearchaeota archaeon]|jgi:ATP-dependent Lon protease|nr:protease Lon-related BREX system protein BrxL [Candidatus Woesearchaeota archaeon]MBT4469965.1 protease Lon-related BREX system protein BrxL [Candidatus Woesearchaeota archaeon]MBT6744311.1 protease Lon-related BREX system protein BrxL [Candidatus Woesearchaeota archaeon]MBT6995651.1 protease Lon-related BREX system protein BrxL [Candidatus Woesearchaeota archaeon]MBT7237431.1 protease Lon-related BREX system protein BrxL [Candidatus Woesearchaeota archaeon]